VEQKAQIMIIDKSALTKLSRVARQLECGQNGNLRGHCSSQHILWMMPFSYHIRSRSRVLYIYKKVLDSGVAVIVQFEVYL